MWFVLWWRYFTSLINVLHLQCVRLFFLSEIVFSRHSRVNVSTPSRGVGLCFCFSVHTQYLFFTDPQIWNQVVVHIQTFVFFLQVLFFNKKLNVSFQFDPAKMKWSVLPSTHIKVQQQAAHLWVCSTENLMSTLHTHHTGSGVLSSLQENLCHTLNTTKIYKQVHKFYFITIIYTHWPHY